MFKRERNRNRKREVLEEKEIERESDKQIKKKGI